MTMTEAKKRNEGTMTLRVDRDLLKAFQNIAKDNNRTASQLVRDYMMNYVKNMDKGIYSSDGFSSSNPIRKISESGSKFR